MNKALKAYYSESQPLIKSAQQMADELQVMVDNFRQLKRIIKEWPSYVSGDDDVTTETGIVNTIEKMFDRMWDDRRQ